MFASGCVGVWVWMGGWTKGKMHKCRRAETPTENQRGSEETAGQEDDEEGGEGR